SPACQAHGGVHSRRSVEKPLTLAAHTDGSHSRTHLGELSQSTDTAADQCGDLRIRKIGESPNKASGIGSCVGQRTVSCAPASGSVSRGSRRKVIVRAISELLGES